MTTLEKTVTRKTHCELSGSFGPDRGKRLVVTLIPGRPKDATHDGIPDMIEVRPHRTSRPERMAVIDVYLMAMRGRVNRENLVKASAAKEKKAARLASERIARAEARLRRESRKACREETAGQ